MKITRILALVLVMWLLQGCAERQVRVERIEPGVALATTAPKGGYLVVMQSYGVSEEWRAQVSDVYFQLRRVDGGGLYNLPSALGWEEDTIAARRAFPRNTRVVSGLLLVELPAGEYEISRFWARATVPVRNMFSSTERQAGVTVYNPAEPLTSRFRVEAGRTTYIGEIQLFMTFQKYGLAFVDRQARDLPLLSKRFPQVDASRVDVRLPVRIKQAIKDENEFPVPQYTTH